MPRYAVPAAVLGVLCLVAAVLVGRTLRVPSVPTFPITVTAPVEVGRRQVGPLVHTVDASDPDRWVGFDFSRGAVVPLQDGDGWDLAFRRFEVIVNGGPRFAGNGGVADLRDVPFESVLRAPPAGYEGTAEDSTLSAVERWYDYSFTSHLLTPRPGVWAVRTAEGGYAKVRFLSYYCPGATPGCVTFRYVYQGDGSRNVEAPGEPGPPARP